MKKILLAYLVVFLSYIYSQFRNVDQLWHLIVWKTLAWLLTVDSEYKEENIVFIWAVYSNAFNLIPILFAEGFLVERRDLKYYWNTDFWKFYLVTLSGRLSETIDVTVCCICSLLEEDWHYTIANLQVQMAVWYSHDASHSTIHMTLCEHMLMLKVCTRWVLWQLTDEPKVAYGMDLTVCDGVSGGRKCLTLTHRYQRWIIYPPVDVADQGIE